MQAGRCKHHAERQAKDADSPRPLRSPLNRETKPLALLLLCNGYDPNLEPSSPLDLALRARRWDLLDLLLEWGADPHRACLTDLFDTYCSEPFERFFTLGVDLTANHELASALAYHPGNKPLFGFAKRHREEDAKFQKELNIALVHHASEGNEKGVQLCLWAGADPHAPVCQRRQYPSRDRLFPAGSRRYHGLRQGRDCYVRARGDRRERDEYQGHTR